MEKSPSLTQAPPAFSSVKFTIIGQPPDLLKRMSDTAAMSASSDGGNWSPLSVPRSPMSNDNQAEGAAYTKSARPSLLQTLGGGEDTQFASASEIPSTQGSDEVAGARSRPLPPVQPQAPSTRTQYSSAGDRSARSLSQSRKASTGSSNTGPTPTLNPNLSMISSNFGPLAVEESGFSNLPSIPNVFNNNSSLGSQTQPHTPQQSLPQQPQLSPTPDLVYPPDAVSSANGGRNHSSHPSRLPLANQHEASGTQPNDHDRLNPVSVSKIDSLKASVAEKVLKVKATIAQNRYSTNTATGPNPGQDTHLHNQAGISALNTQSTLRSPSRSHSIQADAQSNSRFSPGDTRDRDHTHAKASTPQASSSSSASASHPTNSFLDSSSSVPVAPPDIDSILSSTRKTVDDLVSAQAFFQMLLSRAESIESRNTSLQIEVNRLRADNGRLQGQLDQLRIEKTSLIEQIELLREELQTSEEREKQGRQAKDAMEVAADELLRVTEQIADFAEEVKQSLGKHIAEREVLDALDTGTRYENQLKDKLQHERAEALSRQREGESNRMQVETTHDRRSPQTPPPASNAINQTTQPPTPPPTLFRNVQQRRNETSVGGEVALGSIASGNSPDDTQGHFREVSPSGRSSDVDLQMSEQNSVHVNKGEKVRSVIKEEEELSDAVPSAGSTIPERPKPANQNNSQSLIAPPLVASPSNRSAFPDCSQHDQPHSINCPSPQSHVAGSNTRVKSEETLPPDPLSLIVSSNDRQVTSMSITSPTTQASNHSSRQDDGTRMPEHGLGHSRENTTTSNSISPSLAAAPIGGIGGRLASDEALAPNSPNSSHTRKRSGRPSPPVRPVTTSRRQADHYSPSPPPPATIHRRHYPPSPSAAPITSVRHYPPPHPAAHHEPTQARNRKRPREEVMDSYRNEYYSSPPRRARLEDFDRQVVNERDISPRIDGAVQWNGPRTPPIYGPRTPPLPSRDISGWPQHERRVTTEWMHSYENRAYEPDPVLRRKPSPQHLLGAEQEHPTNAGSGSLFSRMKDPNHYSQNPANHPSQQLPHTLLDRMSDSQGNGIPSRLYNQDQANTQSFSYAAKRGQHQNRGGAQGRGQGPTRGGYGKPPRGRGGRVPYAPLAERLSSSKSSNNPPLHDRLS